MRCIKKIINKTYIKKEYILKNLILLRKKEFNDKTI